MTTRMERPSETNRAPKDRWNKPLYYASEPAEIELNGRDLKAKGRRTPDDCPFAHCLKRTFGVAEVEVGRKYTYVDFGDFQIKYTTSTSMARQLTVFDQGGSMEVGVYRLSPIPPGDRWGHDRKGGQHTNTGKPAGPTRRIGPTVVRRRLVS